MGLGFVIKILNPLIEISVSYLEMVLASNYVRLTINHQNDEQTFGWCKQQDFSSSLRTFVAYKVSSDRYASMQPRNDT